MNIELLKKVKTPEETASIVYEILKAKGAYNGVFEQCFQKYLNTMCYN